MTRVNLDIDPAHVERLLEFDKVRKRFAKSQARQTQQAEIPTLNPTELGIEVLPVSASDGEVPELDLSQMEILPFDDE